MEKVIDEAGVYDVARRDPMSFFGSVALPVHQELSAPALVVYCQQLLDLVDRTTISHLRWRGRCGGWNHGAFLGWFYLVHVEGSVNAEGLGQTKPDCCRTYEFSDGERAYKPWRQLAGGDLEA